MTKAVILEIREGYAAVLTDEGLVKKIPDEDYTVGQEIVLPDVDRRRHTGLYRAAAAAAVIILVSGSLHYASENAFAYSTVTVSTEDTSLELTLNRKDEVVAVKALDEKSQMTAGNMKVSFVKRRPLEEMLEELTGESGQADVRVGSRNEEHRQDLEKRVKKMLPPDGPETAGGPGADGQMQETPAGAGEMQAPPAGAGETQAPSAGEINMQNPSAGEGKQQTPPAGEGKQQMPPAEESELQVSPAGGETSVPPTGGGEKQAPSASEGNMQAPPAGEGMTGGGEMQIPSSGGPGIPEGQQKPDMPEMIQGTGVPEGQGQAAPGSVQIPPGGQNAAWGGPSANPGAGPAGGRP